MLSRWYRQAVSRCKSRCKSHSSCARKEQTFRPPSAPVDALPRELAQGSSLENCSLHVRDWIGVGPGAIITRWNGMAADRGLFPVCSLFQVNHSGQDRMFPLTPAPASTGRPAPRGLDGANGQCHTVTWHQHPARGGNPPPLTLVRVTGVLPTVSNHSSPHLPLLPTFLSRWFPQVPLRSPRTVVP